jgi:hypothetical protein
VLAGESQACLTVPTDFQTTDFNNAFVAKLIYNRDKATAVLF